MREHWILPWLLIALAGCGQRTTEAVITDVSWSLQEDAAGRMTIDLRLPAEARSDSGLTVPDPSMSADGALHIGFVLHDPGGRAFRYKIYYRNERYRFPETEHGDQHPLAEENFYGSWPDPGEGFRLSGPTTPDGLPLTEQLVIRSDPRREYSGAPWLRNPRVGEYAAMIVAIPAESFDRDPPLVEVQDLQRKRDGHYVEPWWYWLHGPGSRREDASVLVVPDVARLLVEIKPVRGVSGCSPGITDLDPFRHQIEPSARLNNVPVIADVLGNGYGPVDYDSVLCFTPSRDLINTITQVPADPCSNYRIDSVHACLEILNPAADAGHMRKENTGVRTRHAFTYGRFRVHGQLSPLLNDSGLWNGLTNAVWLIGTADPRALRRACEGGYIAYRSDAGAAGRVDRSTYAEIDFEIMKGVPICPERAFPPIYPQPVLDPDDPSSWRRKLPAEVGQQRGQVALSCTNWDLACPDPPRFDVGCRDVHSAGQVFTSHRWTSDYRAVTQKSMQVDDELFGPGGYWFEIDWRPEEIFWRIGPSLDRMRTVGYMNSSMTSIPNVPMWVVISQEFHNTTWWPGSPYEQGGIPFPAKELVGRIYEVRVE